MDRYRTREGNDVPVEASMSSTRAKIAAIGWGTFYDAVSTTAASFGESVQMHTHLVILQSSPVSCHNIESSGRGSPGRGRGLVGNVGIVLGACDKFHDGEEVNGNLKRIEEWGKKQPGKGKNNKKC